jgi:hypothetical protein
MKIIHSINLEKKRLELHVESNVFNEYYANFTGYAKTYPNLPKGMQIGRDGSTVIISLPIPVLDFSSTNDMQEGIQRIGIEKESTKSLTETVMTLISKFFWMANRHMNQTREFLPLFGYPEEDLKMDVLTAMENKRNLLLIENYSDYLDFSKSEKSPEDYYKVAFNQYLINYETNKSEYSDVVSMLMLGKFDEWREIYKPKLKYTEWF